MLFTKLISDTPLQTTLIQATTEDGQYQANKEQILLTSEDVNHFLLEQGIGDKYVVAGIVADTTLPDDVFNIYVIKVTGDFRYHLLGYLLEYDLETGKLEWIKPFAEITLMPNITFSPDGRFLQATELKDGSQTLHLLELETGELQSYPISNLSNNMIAFDWSADGEWLIAAGDESLHLIAPSKAYVRKVFYETTSCNTAVWVNRETSAVE